MQELGRTLSFLYGLQRFGIKVGLRNISRLLDELGHPERTFPSIHIAGTNGKGSTAALLASILRASGYRTGLYTSPHLVRFNERIRIDGADIDDADLGRLTKRIRPTVEESRATFFEATTAIAFQYFAERQVDVAVIEAGLGGRWDATNVLRPELSIITSIGLDHTDLLGRRLAQIANEKGGIIKSGVPSLLGIEDRGISLLLRRIASSKNSSVIDAPRRAKIVPIEVGLERVTMNLHTPSRTYRKIETSLGGTHQLENARLAVLAAEMLGGRFAGIAEATIRRGLVWVRRNTGFRGRLEVLSRAPIVIADVAHNPDAMKRVARDLKSICGKGLVAIFGVMEDKDYRSMTRELATIARLVVAVRPETSRSLGGKEIVRELHGIGIPAIDGGSVRAGLRIAQSRLHSGEPLLMTGSHFVVGEAISAME